MKKLFITLVLACTTLPSLAQHHGHGFRHHGHHNGHRPGIGWWVAPVVVGAISYELSRQHTVIVQPQPVFVQPTVVQNQNCTPWTETYSSDGTITRTRTCTN